MNYLNELYNYVNNSEVIGLTRELNVFYVNQYFESHDDNVLVLANSLYEANQYYDLLSTLNKDVLIFPMDDFISSVAVAISPDLKIKRLETLNQLNDHKKHIVVTNLMGLLRYLPDCKYANKTQFELKKGMQINRDKFIQILNEFGYTKESMVAATGEYAVRGFIIDLFIIEQEHPVRIEFFGDEIDSIRTFDENNQLSIKEIDKITVLPYIEIETAKKSSILDYLVNPFVFMIEKSQIDAGYVKLCDQIMEYNKSLNENKKYI